jgi:hypothetical protein
MSCRECHARPTTSLCMGGFFTACCCREMSRAPSIVFWVMVYAACNYIGMFFLLAVCACVFCVRAGARLC